MDTWACPGCITTTKSNIKGFKMSQSPSLSDNEIQLLKEMIYWWSNRSSTDKDKANIKFHHKDPKVASIRISGLMYQDACALAKSDPTIGNFNKLVELLLWEKLGKLADYVSDAKDTTTPNGTP